MAGTMTELRELAKGWRWGRRPMVPRSAEPFRGPLPSDEFPTDWARTRPVKAARAVFHRLVLKPVTFNEVDAEVLGLDNLELLDGPVIFVSNHSSHLDASLLVSSLPPAWREKVAVGHTGTLFEPEVRIPFWINAPPGTLTDSEAASVRSLKTTPVTHLDVFPTIMDLLGFWDAPELASLTAEFGQRQSPNFHAIHPAFHPVVMFGLRDEVIGNVKKAMLMLLGAVGFFLLIACVNVANLLLARSEARQREIALRTALGAGRSRLLRLLITESCVLTMTGAAAGVAFAKVSASALTAASPVTFPSFIQPGLNLTVLAFTVGIAGACGVLLGLAPAMHVRWVKLSDTLKETGRGSTGIRSQRMRATLVVAEVALAIVLLIGAGLMIRSVQKLTAIDPGFQPDDLLTLDASIPRLPASAAPSAPGAPPAPPPVAVSVDTLLAQIRAVPGVTAASVASDLPLDGSSSAVFYSAEGDATSGAQTMPRAYVHRVTPEFFDTMGMALKAGRRFQPGEATPGSPAVIVSEGVTRRFWANQDPIGKRIKLGAVNSQNPWLTIVGVVGEVKYRGLPANPTADPDLYFPALDRPIQGVAIRTSVEPSSVTAAVRAAIRRAHPSIVVFNVSTMADLVKAQTAPSTFTTWILGLFAMTALVLSVVGIYGVMSFLVTQRTREFGIRLALGATRRELVGVVLKQGARLIAVGAAIGVVLSLGLSRVLDNLNLLYGVTAMDVASAAAILVLVVVAVLACAVPAARATRVDPVIALRNE